MKRRRVVWSATAREDLERLAERVGEQSLLVANQLVDRLLQRAARLNVFAARGRRVLETAHRREDIRELIVRPFRLIYQIDAGVIRVIGVVDARRDFGTWIRRRLSSLH